MIKTFDIFDFGQPPAVALFIGEARRDESAHDLKCEFTAHDARPQTKNVAIIVLSALMRRIGVAAERRAHAAQLVRSHTRTDAASADQDADLSS